MKTLSLILLSSCILFIQSCRKESFITSPDARVTITVDTLKYDTVFTSAGSITQSFKVINENDRKLRISSVKLMGGNSSVYKINVDGSMGPEVNDLEIEARDSLYVFAQVNVNPNSGNLPFIIRDSIEITYNGRSKLVQLEAWGQNAHFLRDKQVLTDETWNNDLPYVILGYLYIDTNRTLTINKGCRIYVHADAPIIVDGTLRVNGEKDTADRVYFRGDRLDEPYKDFPASWPGIFFLSSSRDNILNYAVLKNGYQAIGAEGPAPNTNPKLILNECIIDNAYDAGIIAINSSIRARNSLISNCGKNIYLVKGGNYQFTHCTVVTYSSSFIQHKDPVLTVSNFANNSTADLDAVFRNCIFWGENGTVEDEVIVVKNGNSVFNVNFDYNLWKVQTPPPNSTVTQVINNQSPLFDSVNTFRHYYDFRLQANSPAINTGNPAAGLTIDLDGKPRPVGLPDLGCFEKQ
ncbi:MAG TPA: choice-of-anchor Q domain-containing protein [Chitinophagaceae bacterium]|nr:choice-of-anchor Q domain-containing protein [Chitinophagaceae bacterium]